jgi:polysaccharide chain length determinant protein (PEP-CTERM system associated)
MLMRGQIEVTPVVPELFVGRETDYKGRIDTFRIHYRSDDAGIARDVANRIANDFIEEHIKSRIQVAGETSEFIENELGRIATRMRELEEQRARLQEENAGVMPSDVQANQGLLSRAYDNLRITQAQLAEAQSDRTYWEQQVGISETQDARQEASPTLRLAQLELALAELRSRGYTEKHPSVVQVLQNMNALRAQIDAGEVPGEEGEKEKAPLTAQQQLAQAAVSRAEQRIVGAQAELQRLEARISELEEKLARAPKVAEALTAITREAENLDSSYREYARKRMDAGAAANMERRQKGEQFRVLESAFLPPQASSPNRPLILALGLLLGLALGAGVAVLLEATDTSFHDSRKLQSMIRIPVLASIPAILLESDRRAQRRQRMRAAFASLVVTGFVLSSSAVGYVYVNGAPGFLRSLAGGADEEAPVPTPPPAAAAADAK